ncbi:hypothetical protein B0H13DRAFT_1568334, partial [Mycena leptocephala]
TYPQDPNLDMDSPDNGPAEPVHPRKHCHGLKVNCPRGKNAHTSYPFGLHATGLPWDYHSIGNDFYLQENTCSGDALGVGDSECIKCKALQSLKQVEGILHRIEYGVHENSPMVFHPVLGLIEIARR